MKQSTIASIALTAISLAILCASCSYNTPEIPAFNVTQQELNNATLLTSNRDTAIVGDPFNGFSSDTVTTRHKLRDLFENIPLDKNITVGTIMVRRAYFYPWKYHERDSLINTVVMVKRESGYYPDGGDWEYMDIKYNKNTDYGLNPNGMLIGFSDNVIRGKITKCANCHALAGKNFVFHRNE